MTARNVWVVDDSPAVSESVVLLLMTEGIPSEGILDVEEVLARLAAGDRPSVMILDLGMPSGGGRRVLAYLTGCPEMAFPVIVVTGMTDGVPKDVAGRVLRVLTKPNDPRELVREVQYVLEKITPKALKE